MARLLIILLSLVCLMVVPACQPVQQSSSQDKIGVGVTLLPQQEFVTAVGGDRVYVTVMVPPGASPHTYEVTPAQMALLSKARLYAKVGTPVEFELTWLEKLIAQNRDMLVVDCSKGIGLVESSDEHEPGMDPHIWTSLKNAVVMVSNICQGLVQVDPSGRSYYEQNRDAYIARLNALDGEIAASLKDIKNHTFIVYHPSWGYFARDYGLQQLAIEEGGKEPQAAYMVRLIQEAKNKNIKVIFVSPEFSTRNAETIAAEIGGRVVAIDPLAGDYLDNMRKVAGAFKDALK